MLKFHRKVNPKEGLIGFYKTGSEIDESTLAIYGYYLQLLRDPKNKGLLTQPLLFLIDPTMEKNKLTIKVGTRASAIWPFLNFFIMRLWLKHSLIITLCLGEEQRVIGRTLN